MERNTAKRTLEKLLSVCICLCMLGAMLPAQVFAEEADTAQTEIVQDTAPKDTVYLSSADDLIQLAKDCRLPYQAGRHPRQRGRHCGQQRRYD